MSWRVVISNIYMYCTCCNVNEVVPPKKVEENIVVV